MGSLIKLIGRLCYVNLDIFDITCLDYHETVNGLVAHGLVAHELVAYGPWTSGSWSSGSMLMD